MKTVRFLEVVAKAGKPEVHLAWVKPAADADLQRLGKANRVLTVHQHLRGSHKDFGTIGIEATADAQFLIFPKSLRLYAEQRVVAINYDLLAAGGPPRTGEPEKIPRTKSARATTPQPVSSGLPTRKPVAVDQDEKSASAAPKITKRKDLSPEEKRTLEIRHALDDLKSGRITQAKRRLAGLLKP